MIHTRSATSFINCGHRNWCVLYVMLYMQASFIHLYTHYTQYVYHVYLTCDITHGKKSHTPICKVHVWQWIALVLCHVFLPNFEVLICNLNDRNFGCAILLLVCTSGHDAKDGACPCMLVNAQESTFAVDWKWDLTQQANSIPDPMDPDQWVRVILLPAGFSARKSSYWTQMCQGFAHLSCEPPTTTGSQYHAIPADIFSKHALLISIRKWWVLVSLPILHLSFTCILPCEQRLNDNLHVDMSFQGCINL